MIYYSTGTQNITADFREATLQGQAPDRGLYFPAAIPPLSRVIIKEPEKLSNEEIALELIRPYTGNTVPEKELISIVTTSVDFKFPLVPVTGKIFSLELFHGPTLAFKDVGARFMSRCLGYFLRNNKKKITVLVATSGDTGGAVASGFYEVEGIDVVLLYPSGKVSRIQEQQLTTLGSNITALEVEGSFDDCQRMVKDAFRHQELNARRQLTSANSINVARWLPQQFYYVFAWKQWADKNHPPVISVPSGNFGNICAGLLVHRAGLPVRHFIAACNANDVVPRYLQSGSYQPRETAHTLSNAMDVGDPSNFIRILELFDNHRASLKKIMTAISIDDEETRNTMSRVFRDHHYRLDPHGAVGFLALERFLKKNGGNGIFLETAHPVKFGSPDRMWKEEELPSSVLGLFQRKKSSIRIKAQSGDLVQFLMNRKL